MDQKFKVLTVAPQIHLNLGWMHVVKTMLDEFKHYEWSYITLGQTNGTPRKYTEEDSDGKEKFSIVEYPARGKEFDFTTNLAEVSFHVKPDAIILTTDVQWLVQYAATSSTIPRIFWIPWDNHDWLQSLDSLAYNADLSIVASKHLQEMFHDHGYDFDLVYYYVDDKAYHPIPREQAMKFKVEKLGIPVDKKVLLYLGKMGARKGYESLFAMARELKKKRDDFVLLMYADAVEPGASSEPFMQMFAHGVEDVVRFVPGVRYDSYLPADFVNMVYNVADVFVSAHGGEGFGLPACEAGLCEKPFVMTNYTTTMEFSDEGKNGLGAKILTFRPVMGINRPIVDHVDMANKVDQLLRDESLRLAMGKNFRKWVLANCSRAIITPKLEAQFEKCRVKKVRME